MNSRGGLLRNRIILLAVVLTSLYGSVVSWLSLNGLEKHFQAGRMPILTLGLVCAIFISTSIAIRSKFRGDRVVFGALAGAFVLATIKLVLPLATEGLLAINTVKALLWTIAVLASVVVLIRGLAQTF